MAGIYLHIPFCKCRCIYCDFYSTTGMQHADAYIDSLCRELALRKDYPDGETIRTVYFGGGTPSQLSVRHFEQVFRTLEQHFTLAADAEITIEANPDDLSETYAESLAALPFNRISMGIQTFNNDTLRLLKRRHDSTQALKAFEHCRKAGFRNISIDLMFGLPGQDMEGWKKDLKHAVALEPEHISAYSLTYEEGTGLWKMREDRRIAEASEELSADMLEYLIKFLEENGYEQYEISNFCRPDRHSRHNSGYWTGEKYLGCGAAAHSYDGRSRQWNPASLTRYMQGVSAGDPAEDREVLDPYDRYNDRVVTGLRTKWGMPYRDLEQEFGERLTRFADERIRELEARGLLEVGDTVRLSRKGLFVADGVMRDLLWIKDEA